MTVEEFRATVKPFTKLSVDGNDFLIEEVTKFRFDDGSFYVKCILNDGYIFADDEVNNMFLLVKEVKILFVQPFPEQLEFDEKRFKFLFSAHAIAEEVAGKEIWKKGYGEKFWDFKSENGSYLSLGVDDDKKKRLDFYERIINCDLVKLHDHAV